MPRPQRVPVNLDYGEFGAYLWIQYKLGLT